MGHAAATRNENMLRTKSKTPGRDGARPSRKGDSRARSAERAREAKRELARRANAAEALENVANVEMLPIPMLPVPIYPS